MATGFMSFPFLVNWRNFNAVCLLFLCSMQGAQATEVDVVGLFPGKAVVVIDGGKPRTLSAGQSTPEGVKLISSDSTSAVIEVDGKRRTVTLGQTISSSFAAAENPSVTLIADVRGHFVTPAIVNGSSTKFLVDTGASLVTMSSEEAKRLGIRYLQGERGFAQTASGVAAFYRITLHNVKVGDISVNQVDAGVIEGNYPAVPLLGMSFLKRVEMKRDGNTMTLTKRY